jgi:hypothetical protein
VSTEVTFTGKTPLLFNNQAAFQAADPSDRAVLYIKDDGDQIYARFEVEDWGTEHVINAGLNGNLRELLKTDVISITDDSDESVHWYQALWAIRQDGKIVFFRSSEYIASSSGCDFDTAIQDNVFQIVGYTDSMFDNSGSSDPSFTPVVTDGLLKFVYRDGQIWTNIDRDADFEVVTHTIGGKDFCNMYLQWLCEDDVPKWVFTLRSDFGALLWQGELNGSNSPIGTYAKTDGDLSGPDSIEIAAADGTTTDVIGGFPNECLPS